MITILFVLCVFIKESALLRMVHVSIPTYKIRGQSANLECDFDLEHDTLYAVQWYRDNEEFYRYAPQHENHKRFYKLDGIKVDLSKSDDRTVHLHQLTLKSTGVYRCEVSAEAPSFNTIAAEGKMEVIYLPREGPRITGNEVEQHSKEYLILNCTSGRSYPAAVLTWDIDGEKTSTVGLARLCSNLTARNVANVTDPSILISYPLTHYSHGLVSSTLGLRVPAARSMQVRCTAKISPEWKEGSEAIIENRHLADSKEAMLLIRSSSCKLKWDLKIIMLFIFMAFINKSNENFCIR